MGKVNGRQKGFGIRVVAAFSRFGGEVGGGGEEFTWEGKGRVVM